MPNITNRYTTSLQQTFFSKIGEENLAAKVVVAGVKHPGIKVQPGKEANLARESGWIDEGREYKTESRFLRRWLERKGGVKIAEIGLPVVEGGGGPGMQGPSTKNTEPSTFPQWLFEVCETCTFSGNLGSEAPILKTSRDTASARAAQYDAGCDVSVTFDAQRK
ncbi:hypothetical protein KM043_005884 [Ampulex compressa]|nr:hypothetical protein KM043_005884 [Ampulex compressa]